METDDAPPPQPNVQLCGRVSARWLFSGQLGVELTFIQGEAGKRGLNELASFMYRKAYEG